MTEGFYTLLGTLLGAIIGGFFTLRVTKINNISQLERDKENHKKDYDIEKLKIEKEQKESLRKEKLLAIKEINNVAGQFERYISLIRSNIESSIKMNVNDFHLQYLERDKKIVKIQTLASMYFPDLLENVRKLFGVHSRYWGNQNILLRIDVKEDFEGYKSMLKPIIELGEEAFAITKEIRDQLSKKAEALREV
ncbi:hypothetical protein [Capnocytophaga gingivalis]|jgi:hypothetical protein|uniref:hypothetical protein n=2 Tax=Capnocytophaga gingivalis TaxID=1017 RepID=UPI0028D8E753|nr:hypothetical protein [Capnocytophaga gingivalis]